MSAREMFEELGYKQIKKNKHFIEYRQQFDKDNQYKVLYEFNFCLEYECVECIILDNLSVHFVRLTNRLNKAIQQQIKELGWEE